MGTMDSLKNSMGGMTDALSGDNPLDGLTGAFSGGAPELQGKTFFKSCHGKYLSAWPDGRVDWNREWKREWEAVNVEKAGEGKVALKSSHGKYLTAMPDGRAEWKAVKLEAEGKWTVEYLGGGIALKSCHGKYLSAQPNGAVEANRDAAKEWETFTAEKD
ncbi:MAG: DUF569 domain-containing protein [Treponema sp.]|jgi:hypothetical protein|nr:DUF569 domain-containing protein [Treponema sp.]